MKVLLRKIRIRRRKLRKLSHAGSQSVPVLQLPVLVKLIAQTAVYIL
jgi:hypothetical protein